MDPHMVGADLPSITFFTVDRLSQFWQNTRMLLAVAMPLLVVIMATTMGGKFIEVLRDAFNSIFSRSKRRENYDYKEREKDRKRDYRD